MLITSIQNPMLKRVRRLITNRKDRLEQQAFIAEGVRLVEEALVSGWSPEVILFSSSLSERGRQLLDTAESSGTPIQEVNPDLLQRVSDTETSQGILAIFPLRSCQFPDQVDFILILDRVRDPGNLGTLLRSALAAGVQAAICTPESADPFSPKVLRSAMGAHFRLPIGNLDWNKIAAFCASQTPPLVVFLSEMEDNLSCWKADLRRPLALVVGGEAEGVSPEARACANFSISIPMPGGAESLNAAVAGSILLFEILRQRSQ